MTFNLRLGSVCSFLFVMFWSLLWFYGVALVQGFWLKALAVFFFPYAWYVGIRKLALLLGLM